MIRGREKHEAVQNTKNLQNQKYKNTRYNARDITIIGKNPIRLCLVLTTGYLNLEVVHRNHVDRIGGSSEIQTEREGARLVFCD